MGDGVSTIQVCDRCGKQLYNSTHLNNNACSLKLATPVPYDGPMEHWHVCFDCAKALRADPFALIEIARLKAVIERIDQSRPHYQL
jgi:hypothetical protein